jgi:hypothetical protein
MGCWSDLPCDLELYHGIQRVRLNREEGQCVCDYCELIGIKMIRAMPLWKAHSWIALLLLTAFLPTPSSGSSRESVVGDDGAFSRAPPHPRPAPAPDSYDFLSKQLG